MIVASALQPVVDKLRQQSPSFNAELAAHEGAGSPNLSIGFGDAGKDPNGQSRDGVTNGHFGWAGRSSTDEPDLNTYKGADIILSNSIKNDPTKVEQDLKHETGHVNHDRTDPTNAVKEFQHTVDTKGAQDHDSRPEEKAADRFKDRVSSEQKAYKKAQKQMKKDGDSDQ